MKIISNIPFLSDFPIAIIRDDLMKNRTYSLAKSYGETSSAGSCDDEWI